MIDSVSYILLDSPRFIDLYAKRPESNPICPNLVTKKLNSRSIIERSISPKRAISRGRKNLLLDFEFKLVRPFVQDNNRYSCRRSPALAANRCGPSPN